MKYTVDLSGVRDREGLHERLRASMDLPDWYGNNLDALYDILTEEGNFWDLTFTACGEAFRAMPDYMASLVLTLSDACDVMPGLMVSLAL